MLLCHPPSTFDFSRFHATSVAALNQTHEQRGKWRDTSGGAALLSLPPPALICERVCPSSLIRLLRESSRTPFAIMDHAYLSERVKALQRELTEIAQHNRQYFAKKSHSPTARAQHKELRERLYQIRSELYALLDSSEARKRAAA